MKITLYTAIVLVPFALATQACGSSSIESLSPVGPSRQAQSPDVELMRVSGAVLDTAGRPLAGAHVAIVESGERVALRRGTVRSAISGSDGRFVLTGPFDRSETVTAEKEGYVTASLTITCVVRCWADRSFYLERPSPSVDIAGQYTLTITADSTCPDLPGDARSRTYSATITPATPAGRYRVQLGGASLSDVYMDSFDAGVAGDYFSFAMVHREEGYPALAEEIEPNTYVTLSGTATATVTPSASAITAAFDGWIAYCALKSPLLGLWSDTDCGSPSSRLPPTPARPVTYTRCDSRNHRMALTRRS